MASVVVVLLEQHLAGLFVERRLGVRGDEQAVRTVRERWLTKEGSDAPLDGLEDVTDAVVALPVLFEGGDADLAGRFFGAKSAERSFRDQLIAPLTLGWKILV